jgi:hypothetical protein
MVKNARDKVGNIRQKKGRVRVRAKKKRQLMGEEGTEK